MKNWQIALVGVGVAVILAASLTTAAFGYMRRTYGYQPYGYPSQPYATQQYPSQPYGRGWGGMMGSYGTGMMGGYGAGMMGWGDTSGWGMPCLGAGGWTENAAASGYATVAVAGYGFHSETLNVTVDTTVTWINMDFVVHNIESGTHNNPTELFESPLLGHMQSWSYTFTEPGEYVYHCDPHPNMEGKIIVVSK